MQFFKLFRIQKFSSMAPPHQAQGCFVKRPQKPEKVLQPVSNNPVSGSSSIVAHTKGRCFIHNSRALHYVGHREPGDKECRPIASQPSTLLSIEQLCMLLFILIHISAPTNSNFIQNSQSILVGYCMVTKCFHFLKETCLG